MDLFKGLTQLLWHERRWNNYIVSCKKYIHGVSLLPLWNPLTREMREGLDELGILQ